MMTMHGGSSVVENRFSIISEGDTGSTAADVKDTNNAITAANLAPSTSTSSMTPLFSAVDSLHQGSPILQSLFSRIEAEFQNIAQENHRLHMENTKCERLFHSVIFVNFLKYVIYS